MKLCFMKWMFGNKGTVDFGYEVDKNGIVYFEYFEYFVVTFIILYFG